MPVRNRTYKGTEYTVACCITDGTGTVQHRGRWPDAQLLAKRLAYSELESMALLDRPVAHRVMNTVDLWTKPQKSGQLTVSFRDCTISITRSLHPQELEL